jgi:DNA relaxase NicK
MINAPEMQDFSSSTTSPSFFPPGNNMGGKSDTVEQKAFIDFFSFTVKVQEVENLEEPEEIQTIEFVKRIEDIEGEGVEGVEIQVVDEGKVRKEVKIVLREVKAWFDVGLETEEGHGLYGYKSSLIFFKDGKRLGFIAWGGNGSIFVSFSGTGCAEIVDWERVRAYVEFIEARITRVDVARDEFSDSPITPESARKTWERGGFCMGGRNPSAAMHDDLGSRRGKTFYAGRRGNGKMVRIYEKGKQLGDADSAWVRIEVEFRNVDRVIPYEVLTSPGLYFLGAYPCLKVFSRFFYEAVERIKTVKTAVKIAYSVLMAWCKRSYGKLINVLQERGESDYFIVHALAREGVPARLLI